MATKLLVVDPDVLRLHPNRILERYGFHPANWKVTAPGVGLMGFRADTILIDTYDNPETLEGQRSLNQWLDQLRTRLSPGGKLFIRAESREYFASLMAEDE